MTLDTVADESRKKMADGVARSPSRLCSRDGKICCYGDALSTIFLLASCLASYFSFSVILVFLFLFFSCIPVCLSSSCPFVCAAAICYSQQVRTVFYSTCSFCLLLCHLYPIPSRNYFVFFIRLILFFFVALISRVAFFLFCSRARYAST